MPSLPLTSLHPTTTFHFAASLSRNVDTEAAVRDLVDEVQACLGPSSVDLACLFFSPHHNERADLLAKTITHDLRPRWMIGCSGEGIIGGPKELETAPAVSLWTASLPHVTIEPVRVTFSPTHDQFHCAGLPGTDLADSTFLLLADPFTTPMQEVLSLFEERYPGTPAIGGLAGGGHDVGETRLLFHDQIVGGGVVGVRLSGPLDVRPVISQGCRPIGERYVVTKADHRFIHELSGVPALQRLQTVFESLDSGERRQAHRALHIGLVIDEHRNRFERGDFLVRNLVGADDSTGAIAIGDRVLEGQTVQFQLRDARSASEDLHLLLAADRAHHASPPGGALVFTCCGRGQGLFGRAHHDAQAVIERLGSIPMAGFFAQGEIGPVGGRNFLHGYTASVALFAERP